MIEAQIQRNRFTTIALFGVAVANAALIAWVLGAMAGSWGVGLGMALVAGIAVLVVHGVYELLVLKGVNARPPDIAEEAQLRPLIEDLAGRMSVPTPRVLVLDTESANAFAVGRRPSKATVVFTTGLLRTLTPAELRGVAAHELAHIANNDTRVSMWSASLLGWALLVSAIGSVIAIGLGAVGIGIMAGGTKSGGISGAIAGIILGLMLVIVAIAAFVGLQAWFLMAKVADLAVHRQREWMADATAAAITNEPRALASALSRINGGPVLLESSRAQSLCFAGAPLTGEWLRDLFSTHPDPDKRIAKLLEFEAGVPALKAQSARPVAAGFRQGVSSKIGVLEPGTSPRHQQISEGAFQIGRARSSTVVVDDPMVSRLQLRGTLSANGWKLEPVRATNPAVLLNVAGETILDRPVSIPAGQVRVGSSILTFFPVQAVDD